MKRSTLSFLLTLLFTLFLLRQSTLTAQETLPAETTVVDLETAEPLPVETSIPEATMIPTLEIGKPEVVATEGRSLPTLMPVVGVLQLLSPAHRSTLSNENITFSWTEVPGARWYRLQLYRKNGKALTRQKFKDTAAICVNGVCSVTLSTSELGLQDGKRYKWKVVAKAADGTKIRIQKQRFDLQLIDDGKLTLISSVDFEDMRSIPFWNFRYGWQQTANPIEAGNSLFVDDFARDVTFRHPLLKNVAIQTRFILESGSINFTLRGSSAGNYQVIVDHSGLVSLFRGNVLLHTSSFILVDSWQNLEISVVRDTIKVSIDGFEVLNVIDSSFLPKGKIFLSTNPSAINKLLLDDLSVWGGTREISNLEASYKQARNNREAIAVQSTSPLTYDLSYFRCGELDDWDCSVFEYGTDGINRKLTPDGVYSKYQNNTEPDRYFAEWSSDGKLLAFSRSLWPDEELWVMNTETDQLVRVSGVDQYPICPSWSPNNDALVFIDDYEGIYLTSPTSPTPVLLASKTGSDNWLICPQWSPQPQSNWIAYYAYEGSGVNIYLQNTLAPYEKRLLKTVYDIEDSIVRWSPDGTKLLYAYNRNSSNSTARLFTVDVTLCIADASQCNTSAIQPVMIASTTTDGFISPVWSPDGERIAFVNDNFDGIYIVDAVENSTPQKVTSSLPNDNSPMWSPDGQWLAVQTSWGDMYGSDLYALRVNGYETIAVKNHSNDPDVGAVHPFWHPESNICGMSTRCVQITPAPNLMTGGLYAEYYNGFQVGQPAAVTTQTVQESINSQPPAVTPDRFSSMWTGNIIFAPPTLTPSSTPTLDPAVTPTSTIDGPSPTPTPTSTPVPMVGDFTLNVQSTNLETSEGFRLWMDGTPVSGDQWTNPEDFPNFNFSFPLDGVEVGTSHEIWLEYYHHQTFSTPDTQPGVSLSWSADGFMTATPSSPFTSTPEGTPDIPVQPLIIPQQVIPADNLSAIAPSGLTTIPENSMWNLAKCNSNPDPRYNGVNTGVVGVVPVFTGTTQETLDMLAVLDFGSSTDLALQPSLTESILEPLGTGMRVPTGLRIHEGPTLNSSKLGVIPWGSVVTVGKRIEFPQQNFQPQVWYQVLEFTPPNGEPPIVLKDYISANFAQYSDEMLNHIGWVAVRVEDQSYFIGVSSTSNLYPCQRKLSEPSTLTFIYNREAAAVYGVRNAENNDHVNGKVLGEPLWNRVTVRGSTDVPYAFFLYPDVQAGVPGKTGSAVFMSQVIWSGGLPMTKPNVAPIPSCGSENDANTTTWRYCHGESTGVASIGWRLHEAVISYYSDWEDADGVPFYQNTLINTKGFQVHTPLYPRDFSPYLYVSEGGPDSQPRPETRAINANDYVGIDQTGLNDFVRQNYGEVSAGDYAFINSGGSNGTHHGLFVVGWGDTKPCSSVWNDTTPLTVVGTQSFQPFSHQLAISLPQNANFNVVPYVVDFAGPANARIQRPIARPFYCTAAPSPSSGTSVSAPGATYFLAGHYWIFFTLPDYVEISPNQLYVSPSWQWTINE